MSASKKKLTARAAGLVLGGVLLLQSGGSCGAPAAGQGHSPGDPSVVAAAPGR